MRSTPIRSEDPNAVQHLQEKIAEAEKLQQAMKAANRIVRLSRLTADEKISQLRAECGLSEANARTLLRPDHAGRIGFPGFELTNNAANLRRLQQRVESLGSEAERPTTSVEFPGGRVEDNAEASRVRIYHDAKPGKEVIAELKASGFHWSHTERCWQRLRNNSARHAASRITGIEWPRTAAAAVAAVEPPTVAANVAPQPGWPARISA